jgi:hypothetical protein
MSGGLYVWRESGVSRFFLLLCLAAVKLFSHQIYFINKFNTFCACSTVCKDNAEINVISVEYKKYWCLATFLGHTVIASFVTLFSEIFV